MHLVAGEPSLRVPANERSVHATSKDQHVLEVKRATHNIMVMVIGIMFPLARREIFAIDRFVFCLIFSTTTLVVIILFCGIHPNVELFVPTYGKEEGSLHFLDRSFVSFRVVGVVDAD